MSERVRGLIATGSQTVGPFFHVGLTTDPAVGVIMAGPETPGEHIRLRVRVTDGDGAPVPDCMVELYVQDTGFLTAPERKPGVLTPTPPERKPGALTPGVLVVARLPTDREGTCLFQTVRPGRIKDGRGGHQASHISVRLFMRGLLRHLDTRVYFAGDPDLGGDAVLALVPEARRGTLFAEHQASAPGTWTFDVHLQGDRETVFFDL